MKKLTTIIFLCLVSFILNAQSKTIKVSKTNTYTFKVNFLNKNSRQSDGFKKYYFEIPRKEMDTTMLKREWFFVDAIFTDTINKKVKLTFMHLTERPGFTVTAFLKDVPASFGPSGASNAAFKTNGVFVIKTYPKPTLKWGEYKHEEKVPIRKFIPCDSVSLDWSYKGVPIPYKIILNEMTFSSEGKLRSCTGAGSKLQPDCFNWVSKISIPSSQDKTTIYLDLRVQGPIKDTFNISGCIRLIK